MKLLVFILTISLCYSLPTLGGFQMLDLTSAQGDSDLHNLIDYGMQNIVQEGIQTQEFSSSNFQLSKINSVYKQVLDGENYQINCYLTNDEAVTVQAEFEIHVDIFTQQRTIVTSSYNVVSKSVEQSVEKTYIQVSSQEVEYSSEIQSVLDYGCDNVIKETKGSRLPFEIVEVYSVYRQTIQTAFFYKCDVNIRYTETQETIRTTFIVYYQPSTDQKSLIDYSADKSLDETENSESSQVIAPIEDQYFPMDTTSVDHDEEVKMCLNYGVEEITKIGISEKKIASLDFYVKLIRSIYSQILGDGIFYKFDCDLENQQGVIIKATFTVYYVLITSQIQLAKYDYQVQSAQTGTDTTMTSSEYTENDAETDEQGYSPMSVQEAQASSVSIDCLEYGYHRVINNGIRAKKIPDSSFEITKVISVSKRVVSRGEYYNYKCQAKSEQGSIITMNFVVYYQYSSQQQTLSSYSFKADGNSEASYTNTEVDTKKTTYKQLRNNEIKYSEEVQECISYGVEQIVQSYGDYRVTKTNSVYRKVVESSVYYKIDVDLTDKQGKTTGLECIVSYQPQIREKYVQAYSYYSKKTTSITSSSTSIASQKYKKLSTKTVQRNQKYSSIMKYGVHECIEKLVSSKVIATSNFQVSKVITAFSQKTISQENYKFKIELTNSAGISVNLNFGVSYQSKTQVRKLTTYYVEGWSKSQSEIMIVNYDYYSQEIQASSCQKVSKSSSTSQAAIQYGVQQVIKNVIKKESVYTKDFKLSKIQNVYSEVVDSSSYKVVATMVNSRNQRIDCSFSVYYKSSKSRELTSYSYTLY